MWFHINPRHPSVVRKLRWQLYVVTTIPLFISWEDQPCLSGSKYWQAVKTVAIEINRNADWLQKTHPGTDYRIILPLTFEFLPIELTLR